MKIRAPNGPAHEPISTETFSTITVGWDGWQGPREALKIGGCKGVFRGKYHKKSVKSNENLLF